MQPAATYESLYEDMHTKLMTLQNAILFAKRDMLHPAILSPLELQKLLFSTKLPHVCIFPTSITNALAAERYSNFRTVHTQITVNLLMFYLVVPVIDFTAYEFDKLLLLPFSHQHPSSILYYFNPKTP